MDETCAAPSAEASAPDALEMFFDQVDAVIGKRTQSRADPLQELAWLGLVPAVGEVAVWSDLSEPQWLTLLYQIAGRCPHLASVLSSVRCAVEHAGESERVGWAQHAYPVAGKEWQLSLPIAHDCMAHWYFADGSRLRRVSASALRAQTATMEQGHVVRCSAVDVAIEGALTGAARARLRSDAAVLLAGCVWRLYQLTVAHAQVRRMFRRNLADFPVIRLRLAVALINVMRTREEAQCIAVRAAQEKDGAGVPYGYAGALRLAAESVRIETQQLCGGSGYMRESAYAQALAWYEWCDGVFRRGGLDAQELTTEQVAHIDDAVRVRLITAGFSATQVDLLLRQAGGEVFGRDGRAA